MSVLFYYEKGDTNFQLWPHRPVSHIMMDLDWDFDHTEIVFHAWFHATVKRVRNKGFGSHIHMEVTHPAQARNSNIFPEKGGDICVT